ncbi:hypothetical protein [Trichococcus flocculiformis]|uniref:hypothetical protein n=1 Tax=Trichococcus flocculiformis TaxID=82803 RepID=UPI002AAAB2B9|nr:hypothetical protein [Trichococcus flocculiformis]
MVLEQFIIDADIIWDQVGKTFFENPEAKPGRIMRVQVVNAGIIEDLTGYTLNLGWTSVRDPSKFGLDAFDDIDITKGIFEIEYTSGMLTNIGPLNASLQLVPPGEGRPIESNNFKLTVKNSAINPAAIQGETSFSTLENALVEVNGWNARIDVVEQDFIQRAINMEAKYPQELNSLGAQLEHKIGGGVKAEPEDLSAATLGLVTGTGGPINLLSVPQDNSVTKSKLSTDLENEINLLFPLDPNPNAMEILNTDSTTVSYFGNAANTAYAEPIVNGIKEYTISTTAAFGGASKPYIAIENEFDVTPTDYLFTCEGDASVAGIFTMIITDGTNTLDTKYIGYTAGTTSKSQAITMPAGATKLKITLFGYNVFAAGENHLTIRNLQLKTVIAQDLDIVARTENLETTVGTLETDVTAIDGRVGALENVPQKSYFILDFDYSPLAWTDANIAIVLDEFGYPFKFNFGVSTDAAIARALVRRGCEMATYFNDAAYLPTTEQFSSAVQADIDKVDAYVKGAIDMQEALGFKDQLVWSTRQFTTGINLENALKKYGFAIERLRTSGTMLPTSFSKNQLTKIYVSDNTTNWYSHTMTGIDTAIANGGSLAIFTHKIVPTDDASGINIIESQYRLILNKIKGYVDAGQAEVITYKQYFEKFRN